MWPWCRHPVDHREAKGRKFICTRKPGHLGKHIAMAIDAWHADRYPNTNGYRRQRRRQGYRGWPARKWRRAANGLLAAVAAYEAEHGVITPEEIAAQAREDHERSVKL